MLSETILKEIDEIRGKFPDQKSALLPALYVVQREFGWLSDDNMKGVAQALNMPEALVRGIASFYAMFRHKPIGRHLIQLCTNVSCMLLGSDSLLNLLKKKYGLEPGGTTEDRRFSLVIMECIGACGTAPAMLVNTDFYDSLTEQNIEGILSKYN